MKSIASAALERVRAMNRRITGRKATAPEITPLERPTDAIYVTRSIVFEVPLADCMYPYGMAYGPHGWHPFVETLHAYQRDRGLTYDRSPLKAFYSAFQPHSFLDLYFPRAFADRHRESELARLTARDHQPFLPWDTKVVRAGGEKDLDASHGHQGFGPVSQEKGELEFARLTRTFQSIERHGYRPRGDGDGEIRGYFLTDGARARFIVRVGQHRTASLAALGRETIRVGFVRSFTRSIDAGSMDHWPLVRRGVFPRTLAREFVELMLGTDGTWIARQAGLAAGKSD